MSKACPLQGQQRCTYTHASGHAHTYEQRIHAESSGAACTCGVEPLVRGGRPAAHAQAHAKN